jgi:hypothetical protein
MIRLASVFWLILVSATALATFAVKYEVQALDVRLAEARKATAAESRELRVLDAEWAYLNRPETLAAMNQRFLSLAPITRKQLQTAADEIPMRPAPAAPSPAAPSPAAPSPAAPSPAAPSPATPSPAAPSPAPPPPLDAGSGPGRAAAPSPPGEPSPVVAASLERPAAPDKPATASPPAGPLPLKATAPPGPPPARFGSVDSRSLDRLIARIVAAR